MNIFATLLIAAEILVPTAKVTEKPDFQENRYPGKVTPIARVDVVPQISGEILKVAFSNGQLVKEGDVLYLLDPVKYEAAVKNAEAKVAETKANARYAELSYARHKRLVDTRAVSLDAVDNALSQRDRSRAEFAAAEAELLSAKDSLKHCTITAPISGKIGSTAKTEGNYVQDGSSPLVSIVQFDPIRVKFSVSNREILDIFSDPLGGRRRKDDVKVSLSLSNGTSFGTDGTIEYTENEADEQTDTITLYAKFANPSRILIPGGTVTVNLSSKAGVMRPAIPPTALLQDTQGPYVWVVNNEGKAERRSIARGNLVGDWLFVEKGLVVGETIVADGAHRVHRGDVIKGASER